MGEHDTVRRKLDPAELRVFSKKLLIDLRALETMLAEGRIESDRRRLGAEQEVVLVDEDWRPAMVNLEILERLPDKRFTTELGRFNIEFNLDPIPIGEHSLREMEEQLRELLETAQSAAREEGARIVLTGILPTLSKSELTLDSMTPHDRYFALNEAMNRVRGRHFSLRIKGRDELIIEHDNVMLESCNTSFQIHYQVSAEEFASHYNIAQLVAAPVLACATNSPLLFGRQLWRETRIALFQQSVDTRGRTDAVRETIPRVSFGRQWVRESALEIFQEDLARFQVLLGGTVEEDPFEVLERGGAPDLTALRVYNSTVYRWNRPCYGVSDGKPHLRIENRILPSGPTTRDEMANAAFWFGLMSGMPRVHDDVGSKIDFGLVRENFVAAARLGLGANFAWLDGRQLPAAELILEELLPVARDGLAALGIGEDDSRRYLDIVEERAASGKSGSQWLIDSLDAMDRGSRHERLAALTAAIAERQGREEPVHTWAPARLAEGGDWRRHCRRVEQIMTTDLFTVNQDELVDMAAYVMNWKHIRHVPVEDHEHRLVGLVTHRALLRLLSTVQGTDHPPVPISDIMQTQVITVRPETPTREALAIMRERKISCLPVINQRGRLVGIVTERDLMRVAAPLLERFLGEEERADRENDDERPVESADTGGS